MRDIHPCVGHKQTWGWDLHEAITQDIQKFREIAETVSDKIMQAIEKELTKVKFTAFGKVKVQ